MSVEPAISTDRLGAFLSTFSITNSYKYRCGFNRIKMTNPKRFYTYAYLREDRTPYYIGKGSGKRVYKKYKNESIKPPTDKSRIIFLKQNLTEEEAFKHEIYMIAVFGRKDLGTGILRNKTNGGEGVSGSIRSENYKRKMSEVKKGKPRSEETRKKMSEGRKGISPSKETRRRMSEANKGRVHSEETKRNLSERHKGKNNPSFGKKWWNDGCGNAKMSIECPGSNWIRGRGKLKKKS
jgi:hypothetical protein